MLRGAAILLVAYSLAANVQSVVDLMTSGMETTFAMLCMLGILWLWVRQERSPRTRVGQVCGPRL